MRSVWLLVLIGLSGCAATPAAAPVPNSTRYSMQAIQPSQGNSSVWRLDSETGSLQWCYLSTSESSSPTAASELIVKCTPPNKP